MHTHSKSLKIAFDNAGGATLFNHNYAHSYSDGRQLAADVISLLAGSDVSQWDGNDVDLREAMRRADLFLYEYVYMLPEIATILAQAAVTVERDEVFIRGYGHRERNGVSGHTEKVFFRSVSAR